jgi:hypothetical protein
MNGAISRGSLFLALSVGLFAEAPAQERRISFGETGLSITAPANWERKQPTSRIVEHEFAIPAAAGEDLPGRMTVMGAGGTVEANIERWVGQFSQPDSSPTKPKVDQRTIAGQKVSVVDIAGTYKDSPGPFSGKPAVDRPDFRMLAAVISTEKDGNYFVKFYGPRGTVAANEKAFSAMLESLTKR